MHNPINPRQNTQKERIFEIKGYIKWNFEQKQKRIIQKTLDK